MKPQAYTRTIVWCSILLLTGCTPGAYTTRPTTTKARPTATPFVQQQLQYRRVREARASAGDRIEQMFRDRNIAYPASQVFIRVFKLERELEVWVLPHSGARFELLRTYKVCALAGTLGPKKRQGDGQVPEGFYSIDFFNPVSAYHLSLRINYPNHRDRLTARARNMGGEIFIHGGCKSDGCIAITNEGIEELYWMAVMARGRHQRSIPVHIFPTRLEKSTDLRKLERLYHDRSVVAFWETLRPGYEYFQQRRRIPQISVDENGRYRIAEAIASAN
jgi:murein L,D-transpeptidase YafK